MFSYFEKLIDPYQEVPLNPPPAGLWAFFWHYIRPVWPIALGVGLAAPANVRLSQKRTKMIERSTSRDTISLMRVRIFVRHRLPVGGRRLWRSRRSGQDA